MLNSTIIQAINDGYQVVLPSLVKKDLKIELKFYNLIITTKVFLKWEDANELERLSWKQFLL